MPRTVLLVTAILVFELGFITSFAGALHAPAPNRVPVAVVASAAEFTGLAAGLRGAPVQLRLVPSAPDADHQLHTGQVFAAVIVTPARLRLLVAPASGPLLVPRIESVFSGAAIAGHMSLSVQDAVPLPAANPQGLVQFYLVVGLVIGGYLLSAVLGLGGGTTPRSLRHGLRRLAVLALYSAASAILALLITDAGLGYQSGHVVVLAAVLALLVFGVGAFAMALIAALGISGTWVVMLLFVVLGNPSAGGAWPGILLAAPWRQLGPWLPNGAGLAATRGILFFGGYDVAAHVLVLAGYALAGTAGVAFLSRRGRPIGPFPAKPGAIGLPSPATQDFRAMPS